MQKFGFKPNNRQLLMRSALYMTGIVDDKPAGGREVKSFHNPVPCADHFINLKIP